MYVDVIAKLRSNKACHAPFLLTNMVILLRVQEKYGEVVPEYMHFSLNQSKIIIKQKFPYQHCAMFTPFLKKAEKHNKQVRF